MVQEDYCEHENPYPNESKPLGIVAAKSLEMAQNAAPGPKRNEGG